MNFSCQALICAASLLALYTARSVAMKALVTAFLHCWGQRLMVGICVRMISSMLGSSAEVVVEGEAGEAEAGESGVAGGG